MAARLGQPPATGGGSEPSRPGAPGGPELAQLRAVYEHAPALVAVHEGAEHVCVYANPRLDRFVGGRPLVGRPLREAMPEFAGASGVERFDAVYRTGMPSEVQDVRATFPDAAAERVVDQALQPWFGPDGTIRGVISFAYDITERKRAKEQQRLLLAELSHRVKNTLAVVQAIAERTGRGAASVAAFLDAFQGRLGALASAHVLLTAGNWRGASLAGIAGATLEPHLTGDDRVFLDVDDLPLKPAVALTLALALHELATNAGKYGALSVPGGRVALSAHVKRSEGGEELRVIWREEGGPPVRRPAASGFGTSLLMQAIEYQHEGRAELEWRKGGLVCRLSLPLEEATAAPL